MYLKEVKIAGPEQSTAIRKYNGLTREAKKLKTGWINDHMQRNHMALKQVTTRNGTFVI
jgi:hypothetical protein